jgi:hypothetical protein
MNVRASRGMCAQALVARAQASCVRRCALDESGEYRATIQITEVGRQNYIDKTWRLPQ